MHIQVYIYIFKHIYTCVLTHTHTHTHIYMMDSLINFDIWGPTAFVSSEVYKSSDCAYKRVIDEVACKTDRTFMVSLNAVKWWWWVLSNFMMPFLAFSSSFIVN